MSNVETLIEALKMALSESHDDVADRVSRYNTIVAMAAKYVDLPHPL